MLEFDISEVEMWSKWLSNVDLSHNWIKGGGCRRGWRGWINLSLNVSYNRLCGRIPVGGRLQELDYTSFFHNRCLCGAPLAECK